VEEEKSRLLHDLGERVKELNCLFGMSRLVENSDISLDAVLQGTADLFPSAMQYPDISCARVVIGNQCFSTKDFKETGWKLQADIEVLGKKAGFVEVRYLEERPAIAEGLFLKEERLLIDAIAERLGKITERKKAEEALKDAKQKWASLTENTDGIVMIVDSEGIIQYINRTIPPYTPEETVGKTVYEYVPREQHDTMRSSLKKTFETGVSFNYVVSSNIPKIGTVWFETKVVPVKDDEKTVSVILMSTDVTKLRNTEERLKETNMKLEDTNEKLRVVGGLTRHDARNKLSAVTGNAYLLRRKLAEDPKALEQLNDMETAVRLVEKIFEFARAYEKLGTEQLVSIDVGKAVDGAGSLFSGLKGVKIVNECGGLTVLADSLLSQLFYNLIDNSLKYGEKTRQIRVYYKMSRSDQLDLVYEDDGVGIPDNMRGNLFKEGFTSGKGTGYGLFMIKRMCGVYGWTIQETGIQGKGARFILTVPEKSQQGKPLYKLP
jgi:PAS domain S-box-containing protein